MITPRRWAQWQDARVNIAAHPLLWPASRLLRRIGAVVRVPGVGIVVNDAALGHEVLTRDALFTKQGPGSIADVMTAAFGPAALSNMDGESHRQLRLRLGPLASAEVAEAWFAEARGTLDQTVDAIAHGEVADVAAAARIFSGHLTLTLLGAPGNDREAAAVHALGSRIAASLQLSPLRQHRVPQARADSAQLVAMVRTAFQRDDLPSSSLVARLRAMGCSEEETRGLLSIFLVAGALTLGVALPRVLQLLIDAQALHRLGDAPSVQAAVEESMRYAAPVPATMRISAVPSRIGALESRAGERIVVLTSNMARDAALFPDPDRYDPTRRPNPKARYLWYGAGAHFCIGFPLAQRVLQHAVTSFAALPGPLRIVSRWPAHGVLLPAWHRLRVARSAP